MERDFGEYGNFQLNEELEHLPNSTSFWQEAKRLGLNGVGFSDEVSPASDLVFLVDDAEALAALEEALEGRYRIAVFDDVNDYVLDDHKEAMELIERAHRSSESSERG